MSLVHSQPERYKTVVPSDEEMTVFLKTADLRTFKTMKFLLQGFNLEQIAEKKVIFSESDRNRGKPVTTGTLRNLIRNHTGYPSSSIRLYGLLENKKGGRMIRN